MDGLNLPPADLTLRTHLDRPEVFDVLRKRYVSLTPEEWVRQHFIHYLLNDLAFPASWCISEASLKYNGMSRRSDILVQNRDGEPFMIVECKAPSVQITQRTIAQVVSYNHILKAPYIVLTNGLKHYACHIERESGSWSFLKGVPGPALMNSSAESST